MVPDQSQVAQPGVSVHGDASAVRDDHLEVADAEASANRAAFKIESCSGSRYAGVISLGEAQVRVGSTESLVDACAGARVIICDEDFCFGGRLLSDRHEIDGRCGQLWVAEKLEELASFPDIRLMSRRSSLCHRNRHARTG